MATKEWTINWSEAKDADWKRSGGQGKLKLVRPSSDPGAAVCVLKELNDQKSPERRMRMYREVVALETRPHPSQPRVLAHNCEKYRENSVQLYAVFDFIEGPTLAEKVRDLGRLPPDDSVSVVTSLLDVLAVHHGEGAGHRDIKPDNIILRSGDPQQTALIDFGLTFNGLEAEENLTSSLQQVGNRFLALPEHAPESDNKRDLRSDLTFCVGILFFTLTGKWPATLSDQNGNAPHQREEPRAILNRLPEPQRRRVLHIFDLGFSQNLNARFQSIAALRQQLGLVMSNVAMQSDTETTLAMLKERAAAKAGNDDILKALNHVADRIEMYARLAVEQMGEGYSAESERRAASMANRDAYIRCDVKANREGQTCSVPFLVTATGNECAVQHLLQDRRDSIARVPIADPEAFPDLKEIVFGLIVAGTSSGLG